MTKKDYRYRIFALVFVLILINYIDRGALSFAVNDIAKEYNLSKFEIGQILGFFGFGYLFGALCGGVFADLFGAKKTWLFFGIMWSIIEILTAWAGNIGAFFFNSAFIGFLIVRILFGFSEGPAYPLMSKTMANWAPKKERSLSLSFGLLSTQIAGLLTAPIAVSLLLISNSWQIMFMVLGSVSLFFLILFYYVFKDDPSQHPRVSSQELRYIKEGKEHISNQTKLPWWVFFTNRTLMLNSFGYFSFLYVVFTLVSWGPKYLQDTFHYNLHSLWYVAIIPWIGSTFTVLLGGYISDYLTKKFSLRVSRSFFAGFMLMLTAVFFVGIPFFNSPFIIIGCLALGNACNAMVNNTYYSVIIDIVPQPNVGAFSGFTLAIANLASIISPLLSGWLVQYYSYDMVFYTTGIIALFGMICMFNLKFEKNKLK